MLLSLIVLLSSVLTFAASHPHPGLQYIRNDKHTGTIFENFSSCWPFQSYHIHVMFWPSNLNSTAAVQQLEAYFMKQFQLTYEANTCPFPNSVISPDYTEICIFKTQYEPAGPFLTGQAPYFIPISYYEKAVSFMVQNRGALDIFVHPNTGCLP